MIGLPTLRLRGDYLAIVTLGFGEILPQIARNGDNLGRLQPDERAERDHAARPAGLGARPLERDRWIPAPELPDVLPRPPRAPDPVGRRVLLDSAAAADHHRVHVAAAPRLAPRPRLGRDPEDETAAAAMGVPLMRTKTWAYATGAFFGGIAGAYYASFKSATFPGDFFFNISVFVLCMVILGGMGNIWGVFLGAALLEYLDREGLANMGSWINGNIHVGGWHPNLDVPLYSSGSTGSSSWS